MAGKERSRWGRERESVVREVRGADTYDTFAFAVFFCFNALKKIEYIDIKQRRNYN